MKGRPDLQEQQFLTSAVSEGGSVDWPDAHVVWIDTDKIDVYSAQTRDDVDKPEYQAYCRQLADSMSLVLPSGKTYGVRRPLEVRPAGEDGRHELVAGESRWRGATLAKLPQVPCIIRNADALENRIDHITDNALRRNLSLWQQAKAIRDDMQTFGLSSEQVIIAHGLANKSELSKINSVFKLRPPAQALVEEGLVDNVNYAYELRQLSDDQVEKLGAHMRKKGAPFKQALAAVTKAATPRKTPAAPGSNDNGAGDGAANDGAGQAGGELMGAPINLGLSVEAARALASLLEVDGGLDDQALQAALLTRINELL